MLTTYGTDHGDGLYAALWRLLGAVWRRFCWGGICTILRRWRVLWRLWGRVAGYLCQLLYPLNRFLLAVIVELFHSGQNQGLRAVCLGGYTCPPENLICIV